MNQKYALMGEETGGEGSSGGDAEVLSMAEELGKSCFQKLL